MERAHQVLTITGLNRDLLLLLRLMVLDRYKGGLTSIVPGGVSFAKAKIHNVMRRHNFGRQLLTLAIGTDGQLKYK